MDIGTNDEPYEQSVPAEDMEVDEKPQVSVFPSVCLPACGHCGNILKSCCSALCKASWPGLQHPVKAWVCIWSTWSCTVCSLVTAMFAAKFCFVACVMSGQRSSCLCPLIQTLPTWSLSASHTVLLSHCHAGTSHLQKQIVTSRLDSNLLHLTLESWTGRHKLAKSEHGNLKSCHLVRAGPSLALVQPRAPPQALPKQARAVQKAQDQLPKQARAVQLRQLLPGQAPRRSALAQGSMRPPRQLPMHLQVSRMSCLYHSVNSPNMSAWPVSPQRISKQSFHDVPATFGGSLCQRFDALTVLSNQACQVHVCRHAPTLACML